MPFVFQKDDLLGDLENGRTLVTFEPRAFICYLFTLSFVYVWLGLATEAL